VLLDGERVEVRWVDGDSLRIRTGVHRGRSARVQGYNSLESYGPVHRWGSWTAEELLAIARSAKAAASAGEWRCTTQGAQDRYQRLLVDCPDAAEALVRRGLAMAYAVGRPADPRTLAAQEEARRAGAGMWAKGAPRRVLTSLHSLDEAEPGAAEVRDRVVDVPTGRAREVRHASRYGTCEERCRGEGPDRTCMTYVPFARRYRDPPACLRAAPP
jgi:endonuclease YncB( thermonuclease family)